MAQDYQQRVMEWNMLIGDKVPARPTMPSEAERVIRCRLLLEETLEFIEASGCVVKFMGDGRMTVVSMPSAGTPDLAKMVHEQVDAIYISLNNLNIMGVPLEPVFMAVHNANLRKCPGGVVQKRGDGKIIKPEGWKPADVGAVVEALRTPALAPPRSCNLHPDCDAADADSKSGRALHCADGSCTDHQ